MIFEIIISSAVFISRPHVAYHGNGRITYSGLKNDGEALRFVLEHWLRSTGDKINKDRSILNDR